MDRTHLSRVAVVGTSATGKTTFARSLGDALRLPHTELDSLYWGPNWTPVPTAKFRASVQRAVDAPAWVIDGNYSGVRDLVWGAATTVVWLNYPFAIVYPRALRRTFRRIVTREKLFAGNRETFAIADPEWIPWWVLRRFWRNRRLFPQLLQQASFPHLHVIELSRPREAQRLLESCGA